MYFWSFKGKNKNVLEWPKNHFKDVNKVADFPYVRGGGVNQHMENSVCFLHIIFESFPYIGGASNLMIQIQSAMLMTKAVMPLLELPILYIMKTKVLLLYTYHIVTFHTNIM